MVDCYMYLPQDLALIPLTVSEKTCSTARCQMPAMDDGRLCHGNSSADTAKSIFCGKCLRYIPCQGLSLVPIIPVCCFKQRYYCGSPSLVFYGGEHFHKRIYQCVSKYVILMFMIIKLKK